jgi:hypothetical protein
MYAKITAKIAASTRRIHIYVLSRKHALEFVANAHQLGSGDFTHNHRFQFWVVPKDLLGNGPLCFCNLAGKRGARCVSAHVPTSVETLGAEHVVTRLAVAVLVLLVGVLVTIGALHGWLPPNLYS